MKVQASDTLIVVDVQRDFCPGGALAVRDADQVVPVINRIVPLFQHPVFTRDWHPADHCSFADPPQFVDGSWPAHCVADSPGAAFHGDLRVPQGALVISKGTRRDGEAYSGFEGTDLSQTLRAQNISRLFVCGLATDYCVKSTALDGAKNGFDVVLIEDACRGVDIPPGTAMRAIDEMKRAGVRVCRSGDLA